MHSKNPSLIFVRRDKPKAICPFNIFKVWGHNYQLTGDSRHNLAILLLICRLSSGGGGGGEPVQFSAFGREIPYETGLVPTRKTHNTSQNQTLKVR